MASVSRRGVLLARNVYLCRVPAGGPEDASSRSVPSVAGLNGVQCIRFRQVSSSLLLNQSKLIRDHQAAAVSQCEPLSTLILVTVI